MKHFAIGDGNKRIACPKRYCADYETDDTTVLWDPEQADMPIRVTVLTIVPQDKGEADHAFWSIINKARERGIPPKVENGKSIFIHREAANVDGDVLHFYYVGLGNNNCIFSITVAEEKETTPTFKQVQSDLEEMIHSLTERGEEEQFQCDLFEGDLKRIDESLKMLFPDGLKNRSWDDLQEHLDRALATSDVDLATRVGLVFGEMMICEVPSFAWIVIFDDHGASRALALGDSGIVIFPEDMIFKRFERDERLDLTQFSSGILEMVENLFRKYQQAAGTGGVQS